jgi:hypothetical protein
MAFPQAILVSASAQQTSSRAAALEASALCGEGAADAQGVIYPERLRHLTQVVETLHACQCVHASTAFVHEVIEEGALLWKGRVEAFTLMGHPKAEEAFAWSWEDEAGRWQCAAVLAIPPILSPREAVRAVVLGEAPGSRRRCTTESAV